MNMIRSLTIASFQVFYVPSAIEHVDVAVLSFFETAFPAVKFTNLELISSLPHGMVTEHNAKVISILAASFQEVR